MIGFDLRSNSEYHLARLMRKGQNGEKCQKYLKFDQFRERLKFTSRGAEISWGDHFFLTPHQGGPVFYLAYCQGGQEKSSLP